MANIKISELTPKGANLASTDLLEISESAGGGTYVTKSITGAQIIGAGGTATWGGITGTLSSQTDLQSALNAKQNTLTLTTTGTSGAATLVGSTLNIPQYSGGASGLQGVHALVPLVSGDQVAATLQSSTSGSGGAYSANRLVAYPFIPNQSFTSSNLQITVTVVGAGALCRIAVYTDLNGNPDTSLFISSNLDCSTTGLKTATASINFVAGTTYWMALHGGTTASINQILVSQMFPIKYSNIHTSANHLWKSLNFSTPTPTTFGGGNTYAAANMPLIVITKA